jgi:hypothetical protein
MSAASGSVTIGAVPDGVTDGGASGCETAALEPDAEFEPTFGSETTSGWDATACAYAVQPRIDPASTVLAILREKNLPITFPISLISTPQFDAILRLQDS